MKNKYRKENIIYENDGKRTYARPTGTYTKVDSITNFIDTFQKRFPEESQDDQFYDAMYDEIHNLTFSELAMADDDIRTALYKLQAIENPTEEEKAKLSRYEIMNEVVHQEYEDLNTTLTEDLDRYTRHHEMNVEPLFQDLYATVEAVRPYIEQQKEVEDPLVAKEIENYINTQMNYITNRYGSRDANYEEKAIVDLFKDLVRDKEPTTLNNQRYILNKMSAVGRAIDQHYDYSDEKDKELWATAPIAQFRKELEESIEQARDNMEISEIQYKAGEIDKYLEKELDSAHMELVVKEIQSYNKEYNDPILNQQMRTIFNRMHHGKYVNYKTNQEQLRNAFKDIQKAMEDSRNRLGIPECSDPQKELLSNKLAVYVYEDFSKTPYPEISENVQKMIDSELRQRKVNSINSRNTNNLLEQVNKEIDIHMDYLNKSVNGNYIMESNKDGFQPKKFQMDVFEQYLELSALKKQLDEHIKDLDRQFHIDEISELGEVDHDRSRQLDVELVKKEIVERLSDEQQKQMFKDFREQGLKDISIADIIDYCDSHYGTDIVNRAIEISDEQFKLSMELAEVPGFENYVKDFASLEELYDGMQKYMEDRINMIEKYDLSNGAKEIAELNKMLRKIERSQLTTGLYIAKHAEQNKVFDKYNNPDMSVKHAKDMIDSLYKLREHYKINGIEKNKEIKIRSLEKELRKERLTHKYNYSYAKDTLEIERALLKPIRHARYHVHNAIQRIKGSSFAMAAQVYKEYWAPQEPKEKPKLFDRIKNFFSKFSVVDKPTKNVKEKAEAVQEKFGVSDKDLDKYRHKKDDPEKEQEKEQEREQEQTKEKTQEVEKETKEQEVSKENKEEKVQETEQTNTKEEKANEQEPKKPININNYEKMFANCNNLNQVSKLIHADIAKTKIDYEQDTVTLGDKKGHQLIFNHRTHEILKNTFQEEIDGKEIDYQKLVEGISDAQIIGEMSQNEYRRGEGKEIYEQVKNMNLKDKENIQSIENTLKNILGIEKGTVKVDIENKLMTAISMGDSKPEYMFSASLENYQDLQILGRDENGQLVECQGDCLSVSMIIDALRENIETTEKEREQVQTKEQEQERDDQFHEVGNDR